MALIRSEESYRPITSEKTTIDQSVYRFNFGWVKKVRKVNGTSMTGTTIETATLKVSGDPNSYSEKSSIEGLPASFTFPGTAPSRGLPSYVKSGTMKKVGTMVKLDGSAPLIYAMGTVPYGIIEVKDYADSIQIGGALQPISIPGIITDGVVTRANGVTTHSISTG